MIARRLIAGALLALLAGCTWFQDDSEPINPPAELDDFDRGYRVERLWSTKVGGGGELLYLGLAPASDGATVYAGAHNGDVLAIDAESGAKRWDLRTKLELSAGPGIGQGLVVFGTSDGELLALDAVDGSERWRIQVGGEVLAAPVIARDRIIVRTVDGRLRAIAVDDGDEIWSIEQQVPRLTLRGNAAPAVADDFVVAAFDNGRIGAYGLRDGEIRWEQLVSPSRGKSELERLADVDARVWVVGRDIYTVSYQGRVASIALENGQILWSQDMSSFAGLSVDWTTVFVTDESSVVVAMNRDSGSVNWRQESLNWRSLTAPVPFADTVVVGDFEGYLHWLDATSGRIVGRVRVDKSAIVRPPVAAGEKVIVQTEDGALQAYRARRIEDA